jgi:methanogenic corrinoid protein MtbC1
LIIGEKYIMVDYEHELIDKFIELDEDSLVDMVENLIKQKVKPLDIVQVCRKAMDKIGTMFANKEIFLTELIMAGELLNVVMQKLGFSKDKQQGNDSQYRGKILIGTVKGDVHDIGKNIVTSLLISNNYKVIDLGVDVPPEKFVEGIKQHKPQIVGLSGLLTIAYDSMKSIIDAIKKAGLRNSVKIMIGGGATDQKVCEYVGADAVGADATDGVTLANKWISSKK